MILAKNLEEDTKMDVIRTINVFKNLFHLVCCVYLSFVYSLEAEIAYYLCDQLCNMFATELMHFR